MGLINTFFKPYDPFLEKDFPVYNCIILHTSTWGSSLNAGDTLVSFETAYMQNIHGAAYSGGNIALPAGRYKIVVEAGIKSSNACIIYLSEIAKSILAVSQSLVNFNWSSNPGTISRLECDAEFSYAPHLKVFIKAGSSAGLLYGATFIARRLDV